MLLESDADLIRRCNFEVDTETIASFPIGVRDTRQEAAQAMVGYLLDHAGGTFRIQDMMRATGLSRKRIASRLKDPTTAFPMEAVRHSGPRVTLWRSTVRPIEQQSSQTDDRYIAQRRSPLLVDYWERIMRKPHRVRKEGWKLIRWSRGTQTTN